MPTAHVQRRSTVTYELERSFLTGPLANAPPGTRRGDRLSEAGGEDLEAGPVGLGLHVVVHDDHLLRAALSMRHDEGGVVHVRDGHGLDAGLDGGARQTVVREDQVGALL